MIKYAKITNEETKKCEVGIGLDENFYKSLGFEQLDVEKAYDGTWYLNGYLPKMPEPSYKEKRILEYPPIQDQLDMIYWDNINNTSLWEGKISEIKNKYPKE